MYQRLQIGRDVRHFTTLASTNTHAASFAGDPAHHGLIITTHEQTAGRGQYERVWSSPPGSGILMSVLLFPPVSLRRPAILTAWAAVSVCETIRIATGLQAKIKWPNDVLIRGKKICGILCEAGTQHVIAGIGLNVLQSSDDFERMQLPEATSLGVQTNHKLNVDDFTHRLIDQLDAAYDLLVRGDLAGLEADWKWRMGLLGRPVVVELMDGNLVSGRLREMAFGGIEVETSEGEKKIWVPEAIRHIREIGRD